MGSDLLEQHLPHIGNSIIRQSISIYDWKYREYSPHESLATASLDSRGTSIRIPFEWAKQKPIWIKQRVIIPESLDHSTVAIRLGLPFGIAWVNGILRQAISETSNLLYLTYEAQANQEFFISIFIEPTLDQHSFYFKSAELLSVDITARRLYNALLMLRDAQNTLDPHTPESKAIQDLIRRTLVFVKYFKPGSEEYPNAIKRAYAFLTRTLESEYKATIPATVHVALFTTINTPIHSSTEHNAKQVLKNFASLSQVMEENPEVVVSIVGVDWYHTLRKYLPATHTYLKRMVLGKRLIVVGNALSLRDYHLHTDEALLRRFLIERSIMQNGETLDIEYFFNNSTNTSFPALPQVLSQLGYKGIVQIHTPENTSVFPYSTFLWKGSDGTTIRTVTTPPPHPLELSSREFLSDVEVLTENIQEGTSSFLQLYDSTTVQHSHIDKLYVLRNLPGLPSIILSSIHEYFKSFSLNNENLESIQDKEYSSCCTPLPYYPYNLIADIHTNEQLLIQAELIAALASGTLAKRSAYKYPFALFEEWWKQHFSSLLAHFAERTATPEQYTVLRGTYRNLQSHCMEITSKAFSYLLEKIPTKSTRTYCTIFNPSPWTRSDYVTITLPEKYSTVHVTDDRGKVIETQILTTSVCNTTDILCYIKDIPAYSTKTIIIEPSSTKETTHRTDWKFTSRSVETPWYAIRFDTKGAITSLYAKHLRRELVANGKKFNLFRIFHEIQKSQSENTKLKALHPVSITIKNFKILEAGPLRGTLLFDLKAENHTSLHVYLFFYHATPRIECKVKLHCKERHSRIETLFALHATAPTLRFGVPFGTAVIQPTSKRNEAIKVPNTWIDLVDKSFGVLFSTEHLVEFSIERSTVAFTLLQTHAVPRHDKSHSSIDFTFYNLGEYTLRYALTPHKDQISNWELIRAAGEFQTPLVVLPNTKGLLPVPLLTFNKNSIQITSIHRIEDNNTFVVRCYETDGVATETTLRSHLPLKSVTECTVANVPLKEHSVSKNHCSLRFKPYEIKTLRIVVDQKQKKR
ncbi:MAG: glycosyl hydrolase-related protein [Bacteroidetes bacterium]|nr:glycosyl hydrolase-related protein [Bacteroidota bacterium]